MTFFESRYFRELYRSILAFPESGYMPVTSSHRADKTHNVINLVRNKRGGYELSDLITGAAESAGSAGSSTRHKSAEPNFDGYKVIVIV